MIYPMLPVENKTKKYIDLFGGYNHNEIISENEFYDMQNMTSDHYPLLASRKKRGVPEYKTPEFYAKNTRGLLYKGDLYQIVANLNTIILLKNGTPFITQATTYADEVERTLVMMGAYIIILPEKLYYNTIDANDYGHMESVFTSNVGDEIIVAPCDIEGNVYDVNGSGTTAPDDAWDGYIWLDTSSEPATLKRFATSNSTWSAISTNYVRITCSGIGTKFSTGDGVNVSGFVNDDIKKLNRSTIIETVLDDDNIVITGVLDNVDNRYAMTAKNNFNNKKNVTLYCNPTLEKDELVGKELILGGKKVLCEKNSVAEKSLEHLINTDDENKWLTAQKATLEVEQDCVNAYRVWVVFDEENPPIGERLEDIEVAFGSQDHLVEVKSLGSVAGNYGSAYLELYEPITVKAGTAIYPVKIEESDTLYVTNVVCSEAVTTSRGNGACVALSALWKQSSPITLTRTMPDLDFVIESNNRLWGCRYGEDDNGNFVNQIYASALGDFKNWSVFSGTAADSYYATVGTSGPFTGAVNYMGYPVFFKEDCIHTVYGAYPSQYQINTTIARGVQKGSHKSLAIINEVLYYKSSDGVMAYTGSLPAVISNKLGKNQYYNAIACGFRDKLYISMCTEENNLDTSELYIYDINCGTWYKESGINASVMLPTKDDVYYLSDFVLKSLFGTGEITEDEVEWFVESGILGIYTSNKKYITKMNVRLWQAINSKVRFLIKYDSDKNWKEIKTSVGRNQIVSICLPILPRRFDHFKIRIEGMGDAKIYSISKTIEEGSDL